ncbi:MAG: CotH kinase family protein [Planctomycetes bacterium]|nr:CotH kinase family protein [Planctomycetota bacterium]
MRAAPTRLGSMAGLVLMACAVASAQTPDLYDKDVLRTFELTFADPFWYLTLAASYPSETYFKADLKVDGATYRNVGVRFRGWSTYRMAEFKKPFKISLDAFVPGQNLYGYRTLNLNNGGNDPTFMREALTYHIFRKYCPAPQACWVKLVVNGIHLGVYVHVEQINKDFGRAWLKNEDGNRYRAELREGAPKDGSALIWLGPNPAVYAECYELKSENSVNPWADLLAVCDTLNNRPLHELEQELPKVLSVDSALWMLALNNAVVNVDTYIAIAHNYYLLNDLFHDRIRLVSWDMDLSFSCTWLDQWTLDPFTRLTDPGRPLISRMLAVPRYREAYLAHLRTVLENDLRWDVIGPLVGKWQALIDREVEADVIKIFSYEAFRKNVTDNVEGRSGLKPLVETRRAYLLGLDDLKKPVPTIAGVQQDPTTNLTARTEVWVKATVTAQAPIQDVFLHYRVRGPFVRVRMLDDGQHRDGAPGDGVFGGRIPPETPGQVEYYLEAVVAAAAGSGTRFEPCSVERSPFTYTVAPDIAINELLAQNTTGLRDERGEREDWIEVMNLTDRTVVLDGLYLSDDLARPTRWRFPANVSLAPGGTLLVWADEEPAEGPLHASFKLDKDGEEIALIDRDGKTLLDWIRFGSQRADVSMGRVHGETNRWVAFPFPTPNGPNRPEPSGHLAYDGIRAAAPLALTVEGAPALGATVTYRVENAPAAQAGFIGLGFGPHHVDLGRPGTLLLDPAVMLLFPVMTGGNGQASQPLRIPQQTTLIGASVYFQGFVMSGQAGGFTNGMITRIGP